MNKNVIYLNSQNFQQEVLNSSKPVLVDFYAEWCGPCKMVSPIIEQVASEYEGRAKVAKLNVDENGPLAAKFKVMGVPSLIFFKDGKEVKRLVGARPKGDITQVLEQLIN